MKFESIFIICHLIKLLFGDFQSGGMLNEVENRERLDSCGKWDPKNGLLDWLFKLNYLDNSTLGVLISPRHILTSSVLILTKNYKFARDGSDLLCPNDGSPHILVDKYNRLNLEVERYPDLKPKRVYLMNICLKPSSYHEEDFPVMIVELMNDYRLNTFPCLADNTTDEPVKVDVWWYGKNDHGGYYEKRSLSLSPLFDYPNVFDGGKENREGEFGGILVTNTGNLTFLGIKSNNVSGQNLFYKLSWLQEGLCKLVGICAEGMAVATTPEVLTSSESTTMDSGSLTSSESFKTSSASRTSSESIPTSSKSLMTSSEPEKLPEDLTSSDYPEEEDPSYYSVYDNPAFREIETPFKKKNGHKMRTFAFFILILLIFLRS